MKSTSVNPGRRFGSVLLATAIAVVCAFAVASSASAGQLVTSKNCSLGAGGTCYTDYYPTGSSYSRFDNDSGGSYNHCAAISTGSGWYGNGCSTSQYAYSSCFVFSSTRARGSTTSAHSYQLHLFKLCA